MKSVSVVFDRVSRVVLKVRTTRVEGLLSAEDGAVPVCCQPEVDPNWSIKKKKTQMRVNHVIWGDHQDKSKSAKTFNLISAPIAN